MDNKPEFVSRDSPGYESWMHCEGPYGVWVAARKDGDTELTRKVCRFMNTQCYSSHMSLTKQAVRSAGNAWCGGHRWGTPQLDPEDIKAFVVW